MRSVSAVGAAVSVVLGIGSIVRAGSTYQAINLDPTASGNIYVAGVGGGKEVVSDSSINHALLWSGSAASQVDLNPPGSPGSAVFGTDGVHQVGYILAPAQQAVMWSGTANSVVNLQPNVAGIQTSDATAVAGNQQVGYAYLAPQVNSSGFNHAFLWNGTAASAIDLQPAFGNESQAYGTDGAQQVGIVTTFHGGIMSGGATQGAVVWSGTAASAVDLSPLNYSSTSASGVWNGIQVGGGINGSGKLRALKWTGTAASVVDINPTGFDESGASAIANGQIVGWASSQDLGDISHAIVWDATTGAFVDLNQFLPAALQPFGSQAIGIDSSGNIVGEAFDDNGKVLPYLWTPLATTPEPASLCLLGVIPAALLRRRGQSSSSPRVAQ